MEAIKNTTLKYFKAYSLFVIMLLPTYAFAQKTETFCAIKKSKMLIMVNKVVSDSVLDNFIAKYDLYDLDLKTTIKSNKVDSLIKLGWNIDKNDPIELVISKSLGAFAEIKNPGAIISFTDKNKAETQLKEEANRNVTFGFNNFYDNVGFAQKDSLVTFMIRGNLNANKVYLAGNFNKWKPNDILMQKNDTGWVVNLKLDPGKYYYKFIVDGNWVFDRDNRLYENDVEANTNSVFFANNVLFTLNGFEKAKKVYVAGSFNNWKPNKLRMLKTSFGWQFLAYLSNGTYSYKFIVDGKWMEDPLNNDKFVNEFGEFNSVLKIGNPTIFKLNGYTDAKKVYLYGLFNNWRRPEISMNKTALGWELPFALNAGNYDYFYDVDNKQIGDTSSINPNGGPAKFALVIKPNYTFKIAGFLNAKTVFLSGDFNGWSPDGFAMTKLKDGWELPMHLNPGKRLYKIIVDGKWLIDPSNTQWEQNEYGNGNSFIWFSTN